MRDIIINDSDICGDCITNHDFSRQINSMEDFLVEFDVCKREMVEGLIFGLSEIERREIETRVEDYIKSKSKYENV